MDDASSPAGAVGRHGLGPHVVGHRVVVRRLLPGETGPSGGPAMTDLLGTCLAWADGACVLAVDDRDGGTRTESVPWSLIVSGKPVPPRTSRWARVTPREAQLRGLSLFPDLETEPAGDWVLRRSATVDARRAGSALAFGPSGVPDDVERVVAHYPHPARPMAAVLADSPEEERLAGLGWTVDGDGPDAWFRVAGVAALQRRLRGLPVPTDVEVVLDEAHPGRWTSVQVAGAARGYAAVDDSPGPGGSWLGLAGLEVDPSHRRRGLGLALVAALVAWGAEQGASTAYLQVHADNAPALALYDRLGFEHHHTYRYLSPA